MSFIKISSKTKTIIGIVSLFILLLIWLGICQYPTVNLVNYIILLIPAFLLIPNEYIQNYSKVLAILCAIIIIIMLLVNIIPHFDAYVLNGSPYGAYGGGMGKNVNRVIVINAILQPIMAIYGLICAFLLTVKSE